MHELLCCYPVLKLILSANSIARLSEFVTSHLKPEPINKGIDASHVKKNVRFRDQLNQEASRECITYPLTDGAH